ncbi:MAG: FCD domain-containing protein, partial [Caldilineales bacterium]|nr:FCD domain-containing protein [Caldilineales bacterium]
MSLTDHARAGLSAAGGLLDRLPVIGDYRSKEKRREADRRLREAIEEHRDIIAAVEARDGDRAAQIMRAHVAGFQSEFLSANRIESG